ncbi:porin family protein [Bacteroides sp. UBA939]|uniref:porin family protein n=1 Tax=Bacteroides sp. UBA939 TaxID=1946092 RepID=UPI0025B89C3E|nr:porin family protein [Bacteroides sp. UBA939]
MKKILGVFIIAICCMFMAMPVQAQLIKWGVKGGVNLSKISLSGEAIDNLKSDNTTGFFIGPMAEITIPIVGLGVDGALLYSQRGKDAFKQQGIEVPVNLKYTIGLGSVLGIYFAAGPDFFFDFKDNKETLGDWSKKKTQVALNLGAGVKLLKHLQVGINYQIPMGDSFTFDDALETAGNEIIGKGKTKTWQVSAAYIF